jgi:DNA-binding transcriptional ArsR family regulator
VRGRRRDGGLRGTGPRTKLTVARKAAARPQLSREALELVARRFRTLGDATRLALLQGLFEGERTVQELCELTQASQANVSKHLALLHDQGLVARRRDGLFTYYRIADHTLERLCRVVCGSLAERHAAVGASFSS